MRRERRSGLLLMRWVHVSTVHPLFHCSQMVLIVQKKHVLSQLVQLITAPAMYIHGDQLTVNSFIWATEMDWNNQWKYYLYHVKVFYCRNRLIKKYRQAFGLCHYQVWKIICCTSCQNKTKNANDEVCNKLGMFLKLDNDLIGQPAYICYWLIFLK